jgi:NtrC-family two-component system sensor histidine kinase KinB
MKRRILLWFCPILILFLGVGLYAVWLFNRLGPSIDVILKENYQSVLAGQTNGFGAFICLGRRRAKRA